MKTGWRRIFQGLCYVMAAVALAMALLFPAPVFVFPEAPLIYGLVVMAFFSGKRGFLSIIRSVCKIE